MAYKKFKSNDIFYNTLEAHPEYNFIVYDSQIYLNHRGATVGTNFTGAAGVDVGHVSLYELNIDRANGNKIYPFITKNGSLSSFKTITTSNFNSSFAYSDELSGSYPMSASIVREYFASTATSRAESANHLSSLKNTLDYYEPLSKHYIFSGTQGSGIGDKGTQTVNLISIPSIIFGSQIKKGTVDLTFYVSGTLIGQLKDENRNGELIQVGPTDSAESGSVAGVVLYNEGFLLLTGNWDMASGDHEAFPGEKYTGAGVVTPKWVYFGAGANDTVGPANVISSSFGVSFKGTSHTQTLTMLAHAEKGELNHSNNSTYKTANQITTALTSSTSYIEPNTLGIKNIVSSSYADPTGSFQKITYISSIGIYDEDRNLIGIAKMATPVKKIENREFTFKLKLDI